MVIGVGEWGAASFENDAASDWFLLVEEAVDPGGVIASALDSAVSEPEDLGLDESCVAIAAAELSASCAGHASVRLPDNVRSWVDAHPHQPHDSEIDQAVQAVQRVREESELRDYWTNCSHETSLRNRTAPPWPRSVTVEDYRPYVRKILHDKGSSIFGQQIT